MSTHPFGEGFKIGILGAKPRSRKPAQGPAVDGFREGVLGAKPGETIEEARERVLAETTEEQKPAG